MDERGIDKLVGRAIRGDAGAFGALYDVYVDRVYGYVRSRIGDGQDAEDVTGTIFIKLFEAIGGYDRRGIPFGAWVFRVSRNCVVDWARQQKRIAEPVDPAHAGEDTWVPGVDVEVLRRAEAGRVRECVGRLGADQAAVLTARFLFGLSVRETAEAMGRTEGAVKALQHRAVRNMMRMLAEEDIDE